MSLSQIRLVESSSSFFPWQESDGRRRWVLILLSILVIGYSFAVLGTVATTGDIGLRCVFKIDVEIAIPDEYQWRSVERPEIDLRPKPGDVLLSIAGLPVASYAGFVHSQRTLGTLIGREVEVSWRNAAGEIEWANALVRQRPFSTYVWSLFWFLQEMLIFGVGARVYWKRPRDDSARLFFWLCLVTVGAYMGGYHWTEIVVAPVLIYPFALFAVFLPVVSLHFYLVFPRLNPIFAAHRRAVMWFLYGLPTVAATLIWACMLWSRYDRDFAADQGRLALSWLSIVALTYVGLATAIYTLCIPCLIWSFRSARTRAERNQAKYILTASALAMPLIGYLLFRAFFNPASLGMDDAAWPMYVVSMLYTIAYALSITRYKLMQVNELINRSAMYFAVSVAAGLLYSVALVVGAFVVGLNLRADQYSREALVVGLTAIVILILSGFARERFQKAIDRRFYREKYKLDQAMRKMSLAVESLVDRSTLGRRLLEAASEVLRLEWGAIYFRQVPGGPLHLVASQGPLPDQTMLDPSNPLVARLAQSPTIRLPQAMALTVEPEPACDALIALGGEAANALEADGELAGVLILGPKRSGLPYEDEEMAFLGALGSVATLALHSAGIQQTLESLNIELRDKVEKIAEQQRRILILQDQLTGQTDGLTRSDAPIVDPSVFDRIKGSSLPIKRLIEMSRKVAPSPSAVLIRGESGTGKELLAEAIHAGSPRVGKPFVKVHCAALSQSLLESELFGHVRGSFTDAVRDRVGRFEQANGGTLFLDEIGDINLEVQTKLLRVLQEMSFERVGSSQPVKVDVRIVAATHQNLEALIEGGRFREDLYYRLNVISITTPSLRDRKEDIFELAVYFLRLHAARVGKPVTHLEDDAVQALMAHDWPGNVRELENVIERAVVLADGPAVTKADLPSEVRTTSGRRRMKQVIGVGGGSNSTRSSSVNIGTPTFEDWDSESIAYERQRLIDALQQCRANKSEAARLLGMPRSTFFSKLKKHNLA